MSTDTLSDMDRLHINGSKPTMEVEDYHIFAEQAVSLEKMYIVDLAVKRLNGTLKCAVAQSCNVSEVYQLENTQFKLLASLEGHSKQVTNVRFSPESDSVLYSSSLDGKLKVWDLRTKGSVRELKDDEAKPLSCMDVSRNDRILCAGTELVEGDAFLLFWDIRSRKLLGGYWESHTDEITNVAFHPQQPDTVATSSMDGLVNIMDLRQPDEDEALQTSLNTESSVAKIRWQGEDSLSVITHTEVVQHWRSDGAAPEDQWTREAVALALGGQTDDTYAVDVHSRSDGELFLLAGSLAGKGELLQTLSVRNGQLKKGQSLIGNRQIVRTSHFVPQTDLLLTAGESGCVCVWRPDTDRNSGHMKKTAKTRNKPKHKPY